MDTTYRLIVLNVDQDILSRGQTAATPELAKLVPGHLRRAGQRLGIERTDWIEEYGKLRVLRSVIVEAEAEPSQWEIGT